MKKHLHIISHSHWDREWYSPFQSFRYNLVEMLDALVEKLSALPEVTINGCHEAPHILSLSLPGYPSANIVTDLGAKGICISAGSACHKGKTSHVVSALGLDKRTAAGVIRLSFGPETTAEDIDAAYEALREHQAKRFPML